MIDVWCVCVGTKYSADRIDALKHMVSKNLTIPYRFRVLSSSNYEGWWAKIDLFAKSSGPSIYFDLDVVITGSIDYLADYTKHHLAAPANWGQSGHGGVQSSVMVWNGENRQPSQRFNYEIDSARLWGDQEFLTEIYGDNYIKIPYVYSYKYHARNQLPDDARVVCFHGKPDYWEVNRDWINQALL